MTAKKDPNPIVGFRMPEKYVALLREAAKKEDRTASYIVRRAIVEWLDAYKKRGKG